MTVPVRNIIPAFLFAAIFLPPQPAARAQVLAKGGCAPNAVKFIVGASQEATTSETMVNVSETKLAFRQGGSKASCVIVAFTAKSSTGTGDVVRMQAVLDNATICSPPDSQFASDDNRLSARALTSVCPNVAPGNHAIQMQFRSLNGGVVTLSDRTTLVQYVQ